MCVYVCVCKVGAFACVVMSLVLLPYSAATVLAATLECVCVGQIDIACLQEEHGTDTKMMESLTEELKWPCQDVM